MLMKFSMIIALLVSVTNFLLLGFYEGYNKGYKEAVNLYSKGFMSGGTIYNELGDIHFYLAFCIAIFIAGKLLKKKILSHIICFTSLFLTLFVYWHWVVALVGNSELTFITNLKQTVSMLDWISFSLVIILLIIQIITAIQRYFD